MTLGLSEHVVGQLRGPELEALARAVGAADGPVVLTATYDLDTRRGRFVLDGATLAAAPVVDARGVDLAPLVPAARALAAWRDAVASRVELRLAAFSLGLRYGDCTAWAAGTVPPDGTAFSPCTGDAGPCGDVAVTRLPADPHCSWGGVGGP